MAAPRILLVEDEPPLAELLLLNLEQHGFVPVWAPDAECAQREVEALVPDAALLDWVLPTASGLDLARRWRACERTRQVRLLMLTARADEADKVAAFEGGVDDYVTKPFSVGELMARIRALLRRSDAAQGAEPVSVDALLLDAAAHRVLWEGSPLRLGPAEFRLLQFLMQNPERVHSRRHLLACLWGSDVQLEERTIDVHVKRLRDALGPARPLLETVRGAGYRLTARPRSDLRDMACLP
jgi:two-component system phosphate regulon response regulator PhoB